MNSHTPAPAPHAAEAHQRRPSGQPHQPHQPRYLRPAEELAARILDLHAELTATTALPNGRGGRHLTAQQTAHLWGELQGLSWALGLHQTPQGPASAAPAPSPVAAPPSLPMGIPAEDADEPAPLDGQDTLIERVTVHLLSSQQDSFGLLGFPAVPHPLPMRAWSAILPLAQLYQLAAALRAALPQSTSLPPVVASEVTGAVAAATRP